MPHCILTRLCTSNHKALLFVLVNKTIRRKVKQPWLRYLNSRCGAGLNTIGRSQKVNLPSGIPKNYRQSSEFFPRKPLAKHVELIKAVIFKRHRAGPGCFLLAYADF